MVPHGQSLPLLLSEAQEGGMSIFLKKLNMGYAKYFNEKYKRSGALFQGKTKRKHIDSDAYMLHILNYIHFNPLDYHRQSKDWRSHSINNQGHALTELSKYRWSSYLDYMGSANFPHLLTMTFMKEVFDDYPREVRSYLKGIERILPGIQNALLE
jgi:putative transposase